jgi:predicted dehydrogenase
MEYTQMLPQDKRMVGIIGFGKRGILHASMVNINPDAEWKAVCDTNAQLLTYMKNFYPNIPFFLDLDEMLGQILLDTVFICTPEGTHLSLVKKLNQKNLNIFVETPLADSLSSSEKMVNLISGKNNVYSVGYYFPFKVLFQKAKNLLDNGALDKVKRYRASMYCTLSQSSHRSERTIINRLSSFFYLIYWFFGPLKCLYGRALHKLTEVKSGISLILDHSSGLMGLLDLSWSRPGYPLPTVNVSVEGTGGTLEISDDNLKLYLYKKKRGLEKGWTTLDISDIPSPSRFFLCEEGYYEENSSFIENCSDKKKSAVGWEDGVEIMRMIEATKLSIDLKRVIFLDEVK